MTKKLIASLSVFALVASMVVVGYVHAQTDNSGSSTQGTDQYGNPQGSYTQPQGSSGSGYAVPVVPVPSGSGQTAPQSGNGNTVIVPVPVNGGGLGGGSNMNLGQLFIYDQLFRGGKTSNSGSTSCPDGDEPGCTSTGSSGSTSNSSNSAIPGVNVRGLGDLFLLGNLFGSSPFSSNYPYVYNGVGGSGSTVMPYYGGGSSPLNNLGNLFVLDRLFANGSNSSGIFGNNTNGSTNLGDLYVLNQLFNH